MTASLFSGSTLFNADHDVGRFDDGSRRYAGFETKLVDCFVGNGGRDDRATDVDRDVGRGCALLHVDDLALQGMLRALIFMAVLLWNIYAWI